MGKVITQSVPRCSPLIRSVIAGVTTRKYWYESDTHKQTNKHVWTAIGGEWAETKREEETREDTYTRTVQTQALIQELISFLTAETFLTGGTSSCAIRY